MHLNSIVNRLPQERYPNLRVAVITTSFPVESGLISGIFVEKLVLYLSQDIDVRVVAPAFIRPKNLSSNLSYHLHCFRYAPRAWQKLAHSPGGIPVALKKQPFLVLLLPLFLGSMFFSCLWFSRKVSVFHANWSVNGVVAGIAGRLLGIPVLTTLRGTDANALRSSWAQRFVLKACLLLSHKVVTVSDAIQNHLTILFPGYAEKLVTIPNGIDEKLLQISVKRDSTSACRILSVGNLVSNKGMGTIIDALSQLSDNATNLKIIGDGVAKSELESAMTSHGLQDKVVFMGSVSHEAVIAEMAASNIFVLASFSEGRPNVILEAMAIGTPVIASNIEGVRELIRDGENGLLFEAGNSQHLAECIDQLASNSGLRARLSRTARQFIIEKGLLWNATAGHYLELYREITKEQDQ